MKHRRRLPVPLLRVVARLVRGPGLGLTRLPGLRHVHEAANRLLHAVALTRLPEEPVAVGAFGHRILVHGRDTGVTPTLVLTGGYEDREVELFAAAIGPGMTVADVGANIGVYTLVAAREAGATGRVYAFEPDPANFDLLTRNVALNGYSNVVAVRAAVSSRTGTTRLFRDAANLGLHSLDERNVTEGVEPIPVRTVCLDDFTEEQGRRIDVLKLDVQGAEALVLAGARHALTPDAIVFMEFWWNGLLNLGADPLRLLGELEERGFGFTLVDDGTRLGRGEVARLSEERGGGGVNLRLARLT